MQTKISHVIVVEICGEHYHPGHDNLAIYSNLEQVWFVTSKTELSDIATGSFVYELLHNDLRVGF